jgi:Predicted choline kinase involved in LPS biosynthesis
LIHAAGVLHGDLRLENLLVTDTGDVTIIDFDQGRNGASEDELREEYALLYDMLHRIIDENEKEATGSTEPEVVVTTKGKRKGRMKKHNDDDTDRIPATTVHNLRPRNGAGKVITNKRP